MKWVVILLLFFFTMVEGAHLYTHHTMDMDADSYVRKFLKKNRDFKIER